MDRKEFLRAVMQRSGIDEYGAKSATLAALADLRDALPPKEAHDLASQLPQGLKETVGAPPAQPKTPHQLQMQALVEHIRSVLPPDERAQASQVTHAIFATLRDAVEPGQMEDILGTIPPELQRDVRPA